MSLDFDLYALIDLGGNEPYRVTPFTTNIIGNFGDMWTAAGVHGALYNSEGKQAADILPALERGVTYLETHYNLIVIGCGSWHFAIRFLREVLTGCRRYPKALIHIC